jgi:hypothetical protein
MIDSSRKGAKALRTVGNTLGFPFAPLRLFARLGSVLFFAGVLIAAAGCQEPSSRSSSAEAEPPWFVDITAESGLTFVHNAGPVGTYFFPQIQGSGAALFDFDNDGRLDIYLIQNGGPNSGSTNKLFHQEPDGRFRDVSQGSGLDVAGYGMGVAIGDVNNDGLPDVFVTEYGRVRLFLNQGNGKFVDITREAGLDNRLWATSACFVDYDRDGWLDLVVVNYVDYASARPCPDSAGKNDFCGPNAFAGTVTKLYRNLGRKPDASCTTVRFEDVTWKSGLGRVPGPGLGVVCADFNGDHWPDILVANDAQPNRLWINQRDGTFKEEAIFRGIGYNALGQAEANMGIALGDVKGDGLFDVFITHLTDETNRLWRQGPRGFFQDRTADSGLAGSHWRGTGFGTVLADFDHDGSLDLALVNGRVKRMSFLGNDDEAMKTLGPFWGPYAERNQLFAGDGAGRFRDLSLVNDPLCRRARVGRGLACGDIDGDGAMDLLVTTIAGPAYLYRNVAPKKGHWLLVRAIDPALHRDAYGAEITVQAGKRRWLGWINPGYSYLCSNDPRAHFGLGQAEHVDAIQVVWPDGTSEAFPDQAVDRQVELKKGGGKPLPNP